MSEPFINHFKNGKPLDDLWEPLKQTKKLIYISNIPIPAGSYVCYVITDGGPSHEIFADKKLALRSYKSSKKEHIKMWGNKEIALMETYATPKGEFIDGMAIA